MAAAVVTLTTVEARPTAVVAQTTTWAEFPKLWGPLLGQVYEFVRPRPELATGDGRELWQNVMLYKDQQPDVEAGVLVPGPFQAQGPVIPSALPAGEVASATHHGGYAKLGVTHDAVRDFAGAMDVNSPARAGRSTAMRGRTRARPRRRCSGCFAEGRVTPEAVYAAAGCRRWGRGRRRVRQNLHTRPHA